jgi:cation diffusion facilitator family transporter
VEVIGGLLSGSLAVLSDAVHLAADLAAFLVAIGGSHIASLPASVSHTFGLRRTESMAALLSMVCLVILSIGLAGEATHRIWVLSFSQGNVVQVNGKMMSSIAAIGVVVNVVLAFVLGEDHAHMPVSSKCSIRIKIYATY